RDGRLGEAVGTTLLRMSAALAVAGLPAVAIGLVAGWRESARRLVDPFLSAGYAVPKIATLPLFLAVFGIGETSRVLIIAASAFFPLAISALSGARRISLVHFEIARHCGASRWRTFASVVWPGALPSVLTGLRISATLALVMAIAIEFVAASRGIGTLLWRSWQTFAIDDLYVALIAASLLGIVLQALIESASRRLLRWAPDRSAA
ncbi:MAG TPA: ABC transporter permease, partial [Thermoanaerobaculia bacterium]|nr:ABC transporter permease [Thermoanaerobaculia bacterium]